MASTHNLQVFQRAVALAGRVVALVQRLPRHAIPGMRSQLARAATSIPANIAEGTGQATPAQFAHSVGLALGSCAEEESQLLLVQQLVPAEWGIAPLLTEAAELGRMLSGLRRYLRTRVGQGGDERR
jgi:four helix bundle protein